MTTDIDGGAEISAIERICRVLDGWQASTSAKGDSASAGVGVDADWPNHVDGAVSILKVLREPDTAMAAAGDGDAWRRMIDVAILGLAQLDLPSSGSPPVRDAGTETHRHDGDWTRRDQRIDESFPASDPAPINPGVD